MENLENELTAEQEEESGILTLTDENGEDVDFEYLDCMTYQGKEYLVLMPADEAETQIVILEVEPVDDENENYLAVEDEAVLDAVYGMFKEKYKDILTFEDLSPRLTKHPARGAFFTGRWRGKIWFINYLRKIPF